MNLEEEIIINNVSITINKLSSDAEYDILEQTNVLEQTNMLSTEEFCEPKSCIICLEFLDDKSVNICTNCDVKCHKKCLNTWYKKHKKKVCPICLKSKKFYKKEKINDDNNNNEIRNELDINSSRNNLNNSDNSDNSDISDNSDSPDNSNRYRNIYMYNPNRFNNFLVNWLCNTRCYVYCFILWVIFIYTYETSY